MTRFVKEQKKEIDEFINVKKNSDDSIITKLTKKFESLFDKENTSINEEKYNKYKNYFSKMIISPYLSKMLQENPEKEIKITLLNNGEDLFIGFLDENNKYPIPNPQSPIPNPQSPIPIFFKYIYIN